MSQSTPPDSPAFDRGPTPYFHGRREILCNFEELLKKSIDTNSGTIVLIQGAPGAGKTALLYELGKLALGSGWETTKKMLVPTALWTPGELSKSLGLKVRSKMPKKVQIGLQLGQAGVVAEWAQETTRSILGSGKKPLLLKLDEAQTIGTTNAPPTTELESVATNVLQAIHNGELSRPVVLLAAGLGTTLEDFASLGISRFGEGASVKLGALGKEAERAVIHDWITKKGGARGDPTAWMDAIVQETNQWPRHVHSYAKHAGGYLEKNGGVMTPQGLKAVMELGQRGRIQYYEQRVVGFDGDELTCLYGAIAEVETGRLFNKGLILDPLKKKYGYERAEKVFKKIIDKGIVSPVDTEYCVPIPSMHDWMKSVLERKHERLRQAEPSENKDTASKSIGPGRDMSSFTPMEPRERTILKPPVQSKEKGNPPKDRGSSPEMER